MDFQKIISLILYMIQSYYTIQVKRMSIMKTNFESFINLLNKCDEVSFGQHCYMRAFDDCWNYHFKNKYRRMVKTESFADNIFTHCHDKIYDDWSFIAVKDKIILNLRDYINITGFDGKPCATKEAYEKLQTMSDDAYYKTKTMDENYGAYIDIITQGKDLLKKDKHIKEHNEWYYKIECLIDDLRYRVQLYEDEGRLY